MNFIKTMFIIVTITAFCCGASFASSKTWGKTSIASKEYGDMVTLKIFENGFKEKNIGVVFPSDECDSYSSIPMNAPSFYINNTKVQMMAQCTAKGIRMDFPKTSSGREYVINELKNKNEVIYYQDKFIATFSAKGFTL